MRKNYVFFTLFFIFLFLALSGQVWTQLSCSNCKVYPPADSPIPREEATVPIPVSDLNDFDGIIELTGLSAITLTCTGNYTLSGIIRSAAGPSVAHLAKGIKN